MLDEMCKNAKRKFNACELFTLSVASEIRFTVKAEYGAPKQYIKRILTKVKDLVLSLPK